MPKRVVIVGPVYPYRAGIAYCTTRTADELRKKFDVKIRSFRRQYPKLFYPGRNDIDPTLVAQTPAGAAFALDILNPFTWLAEGLRIRKMSPDVVIFVWWVWVWALPYLVIRTFLPKRTRVLLQCHNISDKEPAGWKTALTNRVLAAADVLVVHSRSEGDEARRRTGRKAHIEQTFLPVHELGGEIPSRKDAKRQLDLNGDVALFFGHVRPFKGLDIALRAWRNIESRATLLVAGEVWWNDEEKYRSLAKELGLEDRVRFDFRFIPDSEVALHFAAADVVVTPYRTEAQSGVAMTSFHFARPVIATAVGGVPEIIRSGENGILVPPESPDALGSAVDEFFLRSDRKAMENAAAAASRKYSWSRYGSEISEILNKALN